MPRVNKSKKPIFFTQGQEALHRWLKARGYGSAMQAAEVLGVPSSHVSFWTTGRVRPSVMMLPAIEVLTGIPCDAWFVPEEIASRAASLASARAFVESGSPRPRIGLPAGAPKAPASCSDEPAVESP